MVAVAPASIWQMHSDMATAPASDCFAITPSDTVNFVCMAKAVYVGGAGNMTVVTPSGSVVLFSGMTAGSVIPVMCIRVYASATATGLVGLT